jgi:hypothetical protein
MYSLEKIMKKFIYVFPTIFQSSMGLRNESVMVLNGTTQGNFYPIPTCITILITLNFVH